jgi:hypothetical protein
VFAAVLEREAGTSDQVSDRAGDEDFIGVSCGGDASGDMDGETCEVVAAHVALTRVKSHPDIDAQVVCGFGDLAGAANGPCGAVKGGDEAVARCFDLVASKSSELFPYRSIAARVGGGPSA